MIVDNSYCSSAQSFPVAQLFIQNKKQSPYISPKVASLPHLLPLSLTQRAPVIPAYCLFLQHARNALVSETLQLLFHLPRMLSYISICLFPYLSQVFTNLNLSIVCTGDGKLQPMGQIWPLACFCSAHKVRMAFTFLIDKYITQVKNFCDT